MKVKAYKFKENEISLIPIGDMHIGERAFNEHSEKKLDGYIDWVRKKKNAYVFLMGDLMNCSTLSSPGGPFAQNMDLSEQLDKIIELFKPIKNKILGAISGNHEQRLENYCGYNPTIAVCDRLGTYYFGNSGVVIFRLGCHGAKNNPRASFSGYFHHTTGGGSTVGGKMNRVEKLRKVVANADFYCGAHNHMLGVVHDGIFKVNETTEQIDWIRQMLIDTGGYLSYSGSYAEKKQLSPLKLGSPKIRMLIKRKKDNGKEIVSKDIHVSL